MRCDIFILPRAHVELSESGAGVEAGGGMASMRLGVGSSLLKSHMSSTFSPGKMLTSLGGGTWEDGTAACREVLSGGSEPVHAKWTSIWCQGSRRKLTNTSSLNPHKLVRWGVVRFLFIEEEDGAQRNELLGPRSQPNYWHGGN